MLLLWLVSQKISAENDFGICTWKGCKKIYSIWKNTIFQGTHISEQKILKILDFRINDFSQENIAYALDLGPNKIVFKILVSGYEKCGPVIGGKNIIV